MAVYEVQGSGTETGSRIRVEVYGRYVNNGTSIVAGSMGENGVTELAFYGVPEMDEGQTVTLKWQADGENGPVTGGELMAEDEETGDWTCWVGKKMSRYAHVRAYLQVNAGETVWRSYEFGILHAHLPEQELDVVGAVEHPHDVGAEEHQERAGEGGDAKGVREGVCHEACGEADDVLQRQRHLQGQ